jgi:hypothetical protein
LAVHDAESVKKALLHQPGALTQTPGAMQAAEVVMACVQTAAVGFVLQAVIH